ncbi:Carbamoyl-phosphate synthase small chain [Candidatus Annandia adelgestsuga]|uniref:Carbamoyl phosphate synthase small chain n=1 Tax=Candidatus Annandia adelgestsuga TaxID=1302411 RepID=A0A3Q9CLE7_9ENTR|nr:glutamine-hydrolyzing carbamoyl-phosphate synthase small subunit [Candidatus Annandia adelgestsuga]AZP36249.1 Carbamoyl-phosphate synthase small chain [Candidatus Annandia adelgestsuga]
MYNLALLLLHTGEIFYGKSFGATGLTIGEIVFNTSMTGYQEIISDPSYYKQIIMLTYPHIGNVGTNDEDQESYKTYASGLVIKNLSILDSNYRSTMNLHFYLKKNNIISITDIDTRMLTNILRKKGSQKCCIISGKKLNINLAKYKIFFFLGLKNIDLVKKVTNKKIYKWNLGTKNYLKNKHNLYKNIFFKLKIIVYNYGIKHSIMRMLIDRDCILKIKPAFFKINKIIKKKIDGILLSNGPGDPNPCNYIVKNIKLILKKNIPTFGICLGHQLLAMSCGAKIIKMKFGHHGANHPVQNLITKKIMITSQNHNFIIDSKKISKNYKISHISLFDKTIQGIYHKKKMAFSFQGHPEANPGTNDISFLFNDFINIILNNLYYKIKKFILKGVKCQKEQI